LEFALTLLVSSLGLALDQADVHSAFISWICLGLAAVLCVHLAGRIRWVRQRRSHLICSSIAILAAFSVFAVWAVYRNAGATAAALMRKDPRLLADSGTAQPQGREIMPQPPAGIVEPLQEPSKSFASRFMNTDLSSYEARLVQMWIAKQELERTSCPAVFREAGIDLRQLSDFASGVQFYYGGTSPIEGAGQPFGSAKLSDLTGGKTTLTSPVGEYCESRSAFTVTGMPNRPVILCKAFFNQKDTNAQTATLVHELLHLYLSGPDSDHDGIRRRFDINPPEPYSPSDSSNDISGFFQHDCRNLL
jgi:hypothetical protein